MLGIGTIKNVGATAATGDGVFPDPSAIPVGTMFTLDDGVNPAVTFEFVKGGPPGPGNVGIDIAVAVTPDDVRDDVIIAIMGSGIAITASNGGTPTVGLVNNATGTGGEV